MEFKHCILKSSNILEQRCEHHLQGETYFLKSQANGFHVRILSTLNVFYLRNILGRKKNCETTDTARFERLGELDRIFSVTLKTI